MFGDFILSVFRRGFRRVDMIGLFNVFIGKIALSNDLSVKSISFFFQISNYWIMGAEMCDMWTSIDVLCCTASILHLVAIALDRYSKSFLINTNLKSFN